MNNEQINFENTNEITENPNTAETIISAEPQPSEITETVPEVQAEHPVAEAVKEDNVTETVAETDEKSTAEPVAETVENKEVAAEQNVAPALDEKASEAHQNKIRMQEKMNEVYAELNTIKDSGEPLEVEIIARIRGGLRAMYKEVPLFLPASHYSLKRTPTEQELQEAAGKKFLVHIHEFQEYDEGRKAVIVSRKNILTSEFWTSIKVGDIVEGKVSSIATFGVFIDLGGIEGLIHISRLSQVHVDDPGKILHKGDLVKAVVVEVDQNKNRIALSRKELEDSPWKDAEKLYEIGSHHTGIVRRLTDFGAYVELKPGVDGLLRTPEISWTRRVKKPADVLQPGQEIQVEILSVSEEKQTVSLSYKRTQPNPWKSLVDKYPVGTEYNGTIIQVMPQGCVISVDNEIDGFMPRSKMKNILVGNKIPYHPGDNVNVIIADLIPEEESLILTPVITEEQAAQAAESRPPRRNNPPSAPAIDHSKMKNDQSGINLSDMLSEEDRKTLFGTLGE